MFDAIAQIVGLSIGLVVGQSSIISYTTQFIKHHRNSMQNHSKLESMEMVTSGSSTDVFVATLGCLMEHISRLRVSH